MIHLFCAEMQKVWRNRFFIVAFFVLLCTNFFLLWLHTNTASNSISPNAYRTFAQQTQDMSVSEIDIFLKDALDEAEGLWHIDFVLRTEASSGGQKIPAMREQFAQDFEKYYELYQSKNSLEYGNTFEQQVLFLRELSGEVQTVAGYDAFLDSIAQKAKDLSSISIFSQDSYDTKNINSTAQAFENMRKVPLSYYPQPGLVLALELQYTDILSILGMLLISVPLVRMERDSNLLALIRSTSAGRTKTAVAKILTLAVSIVFLLAALYSMNFIYCGQLYGLGPLGRTIQSVPRLLYSTWHLTVGQYLWYFFAAKWAAAFVCGLSVMLVMVLAKRFLFGVLGTLGFLGVHFLLRLLIPATSYLNVIKYANLISLLYTNELLGEYRNLYWFGTPVPLLLVESIAAVLFAVVFVASFIMVFQWHIFRHSTKFVLPWKIFRYNPSYTTPFRQEGYKLLIMQGIALVLLGFSIFQVHTASISNPYMGVKEIYYQYYMQHLEGTFTQEKKQWLEEEIKEFEPIFALNRQLKANTITKDEYEAQMSLYSQLTEKMNVLQTILQSMQQLSEKPRMQIVYEFGWLTLFDNKDNSDIQDALWCSILAAICFSGIFSMEKQTGMIYVISTTLLGKKKTVGYKLIWATIICAILTVFSLVPRFGISVKYGLGAWFAPIYSIAEYASAPEIPMFLMVGILVVSRFLGFLLMAFVIMAISQKIANGFAAMFVSLLIFGVAPLLSTVGLTAAKWCSVYTIFHVPALLAEKGGFIMMILLYCIVLGICYCCYQYLMENFGVAEQKK